MEYQKIYSLTKVTYFDDADPTETGPVLCRSKSDVAAFLKKEKLPSKDLKLNKGYATTRIDFENQSVFISPTDMIVNS